MQPADKPADQVTVSRAVSVLQAVPEDVPVAAPCEFCCVVAFSVAGRWKCFLCSIFLLVVSSRGMFSCWLLLVLELLLPVAATLFVVLLFVGWGIDESVAAIFNCWLLLMLYFRHRQVTVFTVRCFGMALGYCAAAAAVFITFICRVTVVTGVADDG